MGGEILAVAVGLGGRGVGGILAPGGGALDRCLLEAAGADQREARVRAISLTDPEHIERYGLERLADERGTDALVTLDTAVRDARDMSALDTEAAETGTLMAAAG